MRWLMTALVLSGCCGAGEMSSGQTDEALTREMRDRLAAALPQGSTVTIGSTPRTLNVTVGEAAAEMSLDNLSLQCASAPADCEAAKAHMVQATVETFANMGGDEPPSPAQVRAVLHEQSWIDAAGPQIVQRPFAADLHVVYVVDRPTTIATLSPQERTELGLDDAAALETLAQRNMEAALIAFPTAPLAGSPGVSVLSAGDSYEAARLILHDRWMGIAQQANGDLLVSAPCRDQVLFAGARDPSHVEALRAATDRLHASEHHPLSRSILRWMPNGWEVFEAR